MNTRTNRRNRLVSYQTPSTIEAPSVEGGEVPSTKVKDFEFGEVHKGTFSITVKDEDGKELYSNKNEEYEYDRVDAGLATLLQHLGAKLSEDQITFLSESFKASEDKDDTVGKAILSLTNIVRAKDKADAKSAAYQALVNKYKPLEGEKREVAIAKTIQNLVKLSGTSPETIIEMLKAQKAVPEDYTVEAYKMTKLRKTKDEEEE